MRRKIKAVWHEIIERWFLLTLFPTRMEQIDYRNNAIVNPLQALPPYKARDQFRAEGLEAYKWGEKKKAKSQAAIDAVGKAWLRDALMEQPSLEEFLV
jgi:hypothetical protein